MTKTLPFLETLSGRWYSDQNIFERERQSIFAKEWLYVAHETELATPGDYKTVSMADYSIVLLRRDDEIVAFHNVCKHRGASLLNEEKGRLDSDTITCRYHGWSYDLGGTLIAAPYFDCLTDCDESRFKLASVATGIYNGLIFVNLSESPAPLTDTYRELFAQIDSHEFDLSNYRVHSKMFRQGDFNWKVWVEGYQECYHCSTIHPAFGRDFQLEHYRVENHDGYSVHSCPRKGQSASGTTDGLWLFVYPNLGLPIYETCFYTKRVNPLSVRRTALEFTFHVKTDVDDKTIMEFRDFIEEITDQDISVCESVQKNIDSGAFKSGILHETRENGVAYFQSLVRDAVEPL